jgi:hypothetical protein
MRIARVVIALALAAIFTSPALACDTGIKIIQSSGFFTSTDGHSYQYTAIRIDFDNRVISYKDERGWWFTPAVDPAHFDGMAEYLLGREVSTDC